MYYATFIVGLEPLVAEIINQNFPTTKILHHLSGAIIYKSTEPITAPFLNNQFKIIKLSHQTNLDEFLKNLTQNFPSHHFSHNKNPFTHPPSSPGLTRRSNRKTFRIIISDQNHLISIDKNLLKKLENQITKKTNAHPHRSKPQTEYWIQKRSENLILFTERLTHHKPFDKTLTPGTLRPDLCYFLNYLSHPTPTDTFLDPFCGSGAIIKSRAQFPFNLIFGIDTEKTHITNLRKHFKNRNYLIFKNLDFFENNFEDHFIDKIVTDPPWGEYEKLENPEKFYQEILKESHRLLKPQGTLVLLTSRNQKIQQIPTPLKLQKTYEILLSGKKATIYVFTKT